MKKILTLAAAALIGAAANAQISQGDVATGANLVYGFGIENLGLGAKFQYTFIDNVRGEVAFNYFFKKDYQTMWDASINAHYLVSVREDMLYLYPLAGLTFSSLSFDEKGAAKKWGYEAGEKFDDVNRVGLNLGAGAQYQFNEHVGLTLEYRYSLMKDINQSVLGVGVNYKF